jgi:sulfur-oxidizing protein SoxY
VAGLLAGLGLLPQRRRPPGTRPPSTPRPWPTWSRRWAASAPTESKDVTITGPDIAENGAVVPVGCSSALPGVKRLLLLVEKNPSVLAAVFDVTDASTPTSAPA